MNRDETISLFVACEMARQQARHGLYEYDPREAAHEAARSLWNAWAEGMLAERKTLEEAGKWRVERDALEGPLKGQNRETRAWLERAQVDFSGVRFVTGSGRTAGNVSSDPSIEITGATIDFRRFVFPGWSSFEGITVSGATAFERAIFSDMAWFEGATFSGWVDFKGATFRGLSQFKRTTFSGSAGLEGASFSGLADFEKAVFADGAVFQRVAFSGVAQFERTTFSGKALFRDAVFHQNAEFSGATFGGEVGFGRARFSGIAQFKEATFSGSAQFGMAVFAVNADFSRASFLDEASFDEAALGGNAEFSRAIFSSVCHFTEFATLLKQSSNKMRSSTRRVSWGMLGLERSSFRRKHGSLAQSSVA